MFIIEKQINSNRKIHKFLFNNPQITFINTNVSEEDLKFIIYQGICVFSNNFIQLKQAKI